MERSKEFQEFCNQMLQAVKERFPEKVKIEIHKVLKNNSTELDGLVILAPEQMLSPNFYLQLYFEEYKKGVEIGRARVGKECGVRCRSRGGPGA